MGSLFAAAVRSTKVRKESLREGMVFLKVLCLFLCIDLLWGLDVQVAKCCPDPQVLDTESDSCILQVGWHDQETESKTLGQVTGIDLRVQSVEARHVWLNLVTDSLDSILQQPECEGWEAEHTEIGTENGTAWLTKNGQL